MRYRKGKLEKEADKLLKSAKMPEKVKREPIPETPKRISKKESKNKMIIRQGITIEDYNWYIENRKSRRPL